MNNLLKYNHDNGIYTLDLPGPYSTTPLAEKEQDFYNHISNYAKSTWYDYHAIVEAVKRSNLPRGPQLYEELLSKHPTYKSEIFRVLMFDLYDKLFEPGVHSTRSSAYVRLTNYYKGFIDYYLNLIGKTINDYRDSLLANFFLEIQNQNLTALSDVTSKHVTAYIETGRCNGRTLIKMAHQLERCEGLLNDGNCKRIAGYFPPQGGHKNKYAAFNISERKSVIDCIFYSNELTYLERAYGSLAYTYGIRRTDITHLKLENFDWNRGEISFVQQKTGQPYSIIAESFVLNAVYDYITNERPRYQSPFLFLSPHKRAGRYGLINARSICKSIYAKAGVDLMRENIGTNQMRHLCASELLRNGVDKPTISAILGHTCPSSVNAYLDDEPNIRINLEIPKINPTNKYYGKN